MTRSRPATATALRITLHGRTDPAVLCNSLSDLIETQRKTNKILQELHITIDASFNAGRLMSGNGKFLMKAFGALPHLRTVVIRGSFRVPFPVSALTTLFAQAPVPNFVRFCLFQMTLVGTSADFAKFSRAVGKHKALQVFDIDMIHFLQGNQGPIATARANNDTLAASKPPLDPLIKVLIKIPTLKVLLLGGCDVSGLQGCVTTEVMEELFRSKTIERLSLVNFSFSLEQVHKITKALETNECLRNLCISCGHLKCQAKSEGDGAGMTDDIAEQKAREGGKSFANMLRVNKTLRKLILYIAHLDQDEELNMEIFRAVGESKTLKGIYLGSLENISSRSKQALIGMLQSNYVLEEFGFVCANQGITSGLQPYSFEVIKEMTLYLRLNKAGRGSLLQNGNATTKEWVDTLIDVKDDLGCLYYLISRNPSILNPSTMDKQSQRDNNKIKAKRGHKEMVESSTPENEHIVKRKRLYRAVKYTGVSYR